ncbi:MAG: HNH endonuclease family protein, partial [Bacteroidales bacterium]|nr:HNH endonuclease family protein [Bacteroidales bacterium]
LEINVAYPFLMKVYEDYSENVIDKVTFIKVLDFIQSFVWRRFIVGLPTNALNKIFMTLYEKVDKNDYLLSLQKWILKRPSTQRFPKDKEVIESLKLKDVYNINSKNRTYLLERLENFENNELVIIEGNTDITIEHIFPQNPDPKWKVDLGADEYNLIKETYLNTIGNLTLSGNNGKLGNKPFVNKRDLENSGYKDSRLWLNKYLSNAEKWDKTEIERRFDLLAERFIKIWQLPAIEIEERIENNEVNIFEAEEPKHKKLEYAIFFDQKIEVNQVAKLYVEVIKQLFEIQPETFFTTDLAEKISLTKKSKEENLRQPIPINDTYFIEGNFDNIGKFEKIKHALKIFDSEDELTIKYAEQE